MNVSDLLIDMTSKETGSDDYDRIYIPFGKYYDLSLRKVAEEDPSYLDWIVRASREGSFDSDRINSWLERNIRHFDGAKIAAAQAKVNEAPEITLTQHQQDVVDQLLEALESGLPIVRLEGGAGYGKSYATQMLGRMLILQGYSVRAMAVSYVATEVLRQQLDAVGVDCATVAKTLKFTKLWKDKEEVYEFSDDTAPAAHEVLKEKQALIVDECSMISDDVAKLLFETVNAAGGRLILVGDSAQLPPVKQPTKSVCCAAWDRGVATLTQPMRYSTESALYGVEQLARNDPGLLAQMMPTEGDGETAVVPSRRALIDNYVKNYEADPTALHRMLLFRRVEVVEANLAIRAALFGADAPAVNRDESLLVLSTSDYPFVEKKRSYENESVRYYSGEIFRVDTAEPEIYEFSIDTLALEIPHYKVRFANGRRARIMFMVSDTTADVSILGGTEFNEARRAAVEYAKEQVQLNNKSGAWLPYRRLIGDFLRVGYEYATSVHRAQGQTADYVSCHPGPLLSVRGILGQALAYVALTRARKHLTIQI